MLVLAACEITEPDPVQGNGPALPSTYLSGMDTLSVGAVLTGSVSFRLPDSVDRADIDHYALYLDSTLLASGLNPSASHTIDLHNVSEGMHTVFFELYERERSGGLLALLGAPQRILYFPFFVDHWDLRDPIAVSGVQVSWTTFPTIQWTPSTDPHFYAYIVHRHQSVYPSTVAIDSLFDINVSAYVDSAGGGPIHGDSRTYSVEVTNRHRSSSSLPVSISYGTRFPFDNLTKVLVRPGSTELVLITFQQEFIVLSTLTNEVLRRGPVTTSFDFTTWVMTADGSALVQLGLGMMGDTVGGVHTYDAGTLSHTGSWTPSFPMNQSIFASPLDGTMLLTYSQHGTMLLVDGITGTVADSVPAVFQLQNGGRVVGGPDGSSAYALIYEASGFQTRVRRYLITGGQFVFQNERLIAEFISTAEFDDTGTRLAVLYSSSTPEVIDILDPGSLAASVRMYPPPPFQQGSIGYSMTFEGDELTFAHQGAQTGYSIVVVSVSTVEVRQDWQLIGMPYRLIRPPGSSFLYALDVNGPGISGGGFIITP